MMGDLERIIFFIPALYLVLYLGAVAIARRVGQRPPSGP